ncbi:hypothetical protein AB4254_11560 [Vibrio breoganii]
MTAVTNEELMAKVFDEINRVCEMHGFSAPPASYMVSDDVIVANISIYKGDYEEKMRKLFRQHCEVLGFEREWIDESVFISEINQKARIVGLDFDGDKNIVRLLARNGQALNVHPKRLRELMSLT